MSWHEGWLGVEVKLCLRSSIQVVEGIQQRLVMLLMLILVVVEHQRVGEVTRVWRKGDVVVVVVVVPVGAAVVFVFDIQHGFERRVVQIHVVFHTTIAGCRRNGPSGGMILIVVAVRTTTTTHPDIDIR